MRARARVLAGYFQQLPPPARCLSAKLVSEHVVRKGVCACAAAHSQSEHAPAFPGPLVYVSYSSLIGATAEISGFMLRSLTHKGMGDQRVDDGITVVEVVNKRRSL